MLIEFITLLFSVATFKFLKLLHMYNLTSLINDLVIRGFVKLHRGMLLFILQMQDLNSFNLFRNDGITEQ